jgi:adenine deaminase
MKKFIEAASGKTRAQLVLKNADIVDVFTQEIFRGDVALQDGRIVGVGEYSGEKELDCSGKYIAPSFIDSHMHLESSLVTPAAYSDAVLPHGVTTVIADPHEIANVAGKEGIKYILDSSEKTVLDIFMMLPSCVPATQFESSGATLTADDLEEFYLHERVLGLGEVMNYPAVLNCEPDMLRKIAGSINRGKLVDGHGAGLRVNEMNAYTSAGN